MHHAHIRFTPADLSGYDFGILKQYPKYVIAHEIAAPGLGQSQEHYHIYLECEETEKTIRNRFLSDFNIPKSGRGVNNKYYCLKYDAYIYPSPEYIVKYGDIIDYGGYTKEMIDEYRDNGNLIYGHKNINDIDLSTPETKKIISETVINSVNVKRETEFDKLLSEFEDITDYSNKTMTFIRKWIMSYYLNQRKPIPRSGDLNRYTYSIWAITHERENNIEICDAEAVLCNVNI